MRPSRLDQVLADPPSWAVSAHRAFLFVLPLLLTAYGVWYDALAAGEAPDLLQVLTFAATGTSLYLARRVPVVTVLCALACWSLTESCVFVIAVAYLLGRWQPRAWLPLLVLLAVVHPLGLVPDPCAYRAGHTSLPPETTPLFAVVSPALVGGIILTSIRLATTREARLRADAAAAEDRARTIIATDRLRLSQEMHDLLGQRVSRMVLHATAISATTYDAQAKDLASRIADTGASTVEDLHYVVGLLRTTPAEVALSPADSPTAHDAIEQSRRDGTRVDVHGLDDVGRLAEPLVRLVDAVIGETLHNAAKYSGGADVSILAEVFRDRLVLRIENEPVHRPQPILLPSGGHGLSRLRERATEHHGLLTSGPTEEGGYAVSLEVPL
nr:sensor histidine kinase [Frondihabitans sp. VKM Ac-2883]